MRGAHARFTRWFDTDIDLSIRMQHCQDGSLMRHVPTTKTVLEPPRQHHIIRQDTAQAHRLWERSAQRSQTPGPLHQASLLSQAATVECT